MVIMFCLKREAMLYLIQVIQNMLISPHTNGHAVCGRLTPNDVERFRNGSVRELKLNVNSNVDLNVNSAENRLAKHSVYQVKSTKDEKTTLHQEEQRYEVKMKSIWKLTLLVFFLSLLLL
jgi:hypothetical protein